MPISSYKRFKCPKCGYAKSIYCGDMIVIFPLCDKCQSVMEFDEF